MYSDDLAAAIAEGDLFTLPIRGETVTFRVRGIHHIEKVQRLTRCGREMVRSTRNRIHYSIEGIGGRLDGARYTTTFEDGKWTRSLNR